MRRSMAQPVHHPILVVDIEESSSRPADVRVRLQRDAAELIDATLADAGVNPDDCSIDERGDGALLVLPPTAVKTLLTDACLHRLPMRLERLAQQHAAIARLRLRIALNSGELIRTAQGSWLGDAVDRTFRLADAQLTKDVLADARDATMALVVSETWFDGTVRSGLGAAREQDFRSVDFTSHGKRFGGWLALPGACSPEAAIASSRREHGSDDPSVDSVPSVPDPPRTQDRDSITMTAKVSGGGGAYMAAGDQTINIGGQK